MAHVIQKTQFLDGTRTVFHFYLESDGASGELTNYTLVDPVVDLTPPMLAGRDLTIERIHYELTGFTAKLFFDAVTSKWVAWVLTPQSGSAAHKFHSFGNLPDRSVLLDATGKLQTTTVGFATAGSRGVIVLYLKRSR